MKMLEKEHLEIISSILMRGNNVEIRIKPKTGEIVIFEVKKTIKSGK